MDGKQYQKTLSEKGISNYWILIAEYVILFGAGIIAILLHAKFRYPLNIPGHHGFEFMAILMACRTLSKIKWASSVSSLGIGFILLFPLFGFKDPFMGINYMFPGFILDLGYNLLKRSKYQFLYFSILAGLAYFSIPIGRIILQAATGYQYLSFIKFGFFIPVFNFFVFGLIGGLVGQGVSNLISKKVHQKK